MKNFFPIIWLSTFLLSLFLGIEAIACTGIKLTPKDGMSIHGRTLEFGIDIDLSIVFIPREYAFTGTTPEGPGLQYKSKYASLGAIAFNQLAILDGINEKGLSVGTFYFPGFADYVPTNSTNQSKSLSPIDFSNWILTQFSTIEEVQAGLKDVFIAPTILKEWGNETPPFHYIVYDKSGKSLVIEPLQKHLVTYDNKLGVITNSPAFDWHMTNLRNYIHLTPINAKPVKIGGVELFPFGQGSGMVGIPGDFTPPSRFIRAVIFCNTATPSSSSNDAVNEAFHILNQFDIPFGAIKEEEKGLAYTDYTLITCVRDPHTLKYYFKTYKDQSIKMIDFKKFDPDAKVVKRYDVSGLESIEDLSSKLR